MARALIKDWNHARVVLTIARQGSLARAAKMLAVNHSTVFRHLNALEKKLGTPLFDRLPGGAYRPTSVGSRMAAAAERMEDEALSFERDVAGRDRHLSGRLRVTSAETLAYRQLTPHFAAFRCAHPGIVVELSIDNRILNLSRREADIALRPQRPKEGDLWGRKIAGVAWAIYGARHYVDSNRFQSSPAKGISRHPLIGWEEGAPRFGAANWLDQAAPANSFVYRTASLVNQLLAAKAGMGLAVLPCYLGDPEPELARAFPKPIPELAAELWIVTHVDLKQTARVRAFFDFICERLVSDRDLFEGRYTSVPRRS